MIRYPCYTCGARLAVHEWSAARPEICHDCGVSSLAPVQSPATVGVAVGAVVAVAAALPAAEPAPVEAVATPMPRGRSLVALGLFALVLAVSLAVWVGVWRGWR